MEQILELENVRKNYKGFSLKGVTFSLPTGYIMGLVGPNGAGKTTVIKLIMNLIRRDGGEIKVFGQDNIKNEVAIKQRIGFVYDEPTFYEDVNLSNIKAAYCLFYDGWKEELFQSLAADFDLPLQKKFKNLSQGMKIKFALSLALSHDADFILLDEPTTGLDPVFRRKLLERLSGLLEEERKSILFSTHITSDLERIADYITFIRDGEIVFSTTKDTLAENWGIVKGGEGLLNNGYRHLLKGYRKGKFGVEMLTSNISEARRQLPQSTVIEKASLDEIMYFMTKGKTHA